MDSESHDIKQYFEQAVEWISKVISESEDHRILIHCFAGKSRATTITLSYLMKEKKMTLKEGLDLIVSVRPFACPNKGFMVQLKEYE